MEPKAFMCYLLGKGNADKGLVCMMASKYHWYIIYIISYLPHLVAWSVFSMADYPKNVPPYSCTVMKKVHCPLKWSKCLRILINLCMAKKPIFFSTICFHVIFWDLHKDHLNHKNLFLNGILSNLLIWKWQHNFHQHYEILIFSGRFVDGFYDMMKVNAQRLN